MPRKAKRDGGPSPDAMRRSAVQPPRSNQPRQVPSGLPFGERQQLEQAQQAVPLPDAAGRMQSAIDAINANQTAPDYGNMLAQPSNAPEEPATAGLPVGPGPGPGPMQIPPTPVTVDDVAMARYLPALEALADQPGTSNQTRNWVRLMRGQLPPNLTMANVVKPQPVSPPPSQPPLSPPPAVP